MIIHDAKGKPISTYITDDDGNRVVPINITNAEDEYTHGVITVAFEHHEIHEGHHFFVNGYQDLSINNVLQFTWQMPNTTSWANWAWDLDTENETLWQVYEGGTISSALSNALTPLNNNRNSANTSGTTLKYEVHSDLAAADSKVDISGALLIESGIAGSGRRTGGNTNREKEIILKQNTLYVIRVTASAAGYVNYNSQWYEHASSE